MVRFKDMQKRNTKFWEVGGVLVIGGLTLALVLFMGSFAQKSAVQSESGVTSINQPPAPDTPENAASKKAKSAVEIEPAKGPIPDICKDSEANDFSCYEEFYAKLVREKGISAAFADLKARYPKNQFIQTQCHPVTHVLGRTAAEKFTKVSEAYTYGDNFCASGYYHGILETFAHRIGIENLKKDMNSVCAELNTDKTYGLDYYNCVHGLGHGLMAVTDDELFKSLDYCNGLTGDWEQFSCASGVYMENIIADGLNHTTKYLDPKRPLYPCSDSPDKYKGACYFLQTSYMLKIDHEDFSQTFAWCSQAGKNEYLCDQSLGRDASGRSLADGAKTHAICMLGKNNDQITNCMIGGVKDIIYYFHSDKQGLAFCNLFDDPIKSTCLSTARSYYQSF